MGQERFSQQPEELNSAAAADEQSADERSSREIESLVSEEKIVSFIDNQEEPTGLVVAVIDRRIGPAVNDMDPEELAFARKMEFSRFRRSGKSSLVEHYLSTERGHSGGKAAS